MQNERVSSPKFIIILIFCVYLRPRRQQKMKRFLILFSFLLLNGPGNAQVSTRESNSANTQSSDIFKRLDQNPRLSELVKLHIRRNQQGGKTQGFRVEIFFSSELNARQKAQNIKGEFLASYPDFNVYITYVSPDFKVRVGDFRTKNEALKLMKEIQYRFPKAFVVPDLIELPRLF